MGRALTIFFGLLAFGLLCFWCLGHSGHIQSEVGANANRALASGGFGFARAQADGQNVVLTGTADSAAARDAAVRTALAAPGVVAVDNRIVLLADAPPPGPDSSPVVLESIEESVAEETSSEAPIEATPLTQTPAAAPPEPERIEVRLAAATQQATVTGRLLAEDLAPDRETEVSAMLATALPGWQLEAALTPDAGVETGVNLALVEVLPLLREAQSAELEADAEGIRVNARLARFTERTALQERLDALAAGPGAGTELSWLLDSPTATEERCQQAFDELLGSDAILFTTSKAEIRNSSYPLLDKLVEVATDCEVRVEIAGHTDSRGSAEFNNYLSQARADSVRAYLVSKGVNGERVTARGFGPSQPIADNNTVNGRQRNRRIEFRVIRTDS